MSLETFKDRFPLSTPGKIYFTTQCLDCELGRDTAPTIFRKDDSEGLSYVHKQPKTEDEHQQIKECIEGCCTQAIHNDGDLYDWDFEFLIAEGYTRPPTLRERSKKPSSP